MIVLLSATDESLHMFQLLTEKLQEYRVTLSLERIFTKCHKAIKKKSKLLCKKLPVKRSSLLPSFIQDLKEEDVRDSEPEEPRHAYYRALGRSGSARPSRLSTTCP